MRIRLRINDSFCESQHYRARALTHLNLKMHLFIVFLFFVFFAELLNSETYIRNLPPRPAPTPLRCPLMEIKKVGASAVKEFSAASDYIQVKEGKKNYDK